MPQPSISIEATFVPEAWIDDYATEVDGRLVFDVTGKILAMSVQEIHKLQDNQKETDALAKEYSDKHDGPFRVEVCDNICSFFEVDALEDITEEMLQYQRTLHEPLYLEALIIAQKRANMPEWANGKTETAYDVGARLFTIDGSEIGNAIVVSAGEEGGEVLVDIVTDDGILITYPKQALSDLFYYPLFTMDVEKSSGVRLRKLATSSPKP